VKNKQLILWSAILVIIGFSCDDNPLEPFLPKTMSLVFYDGARYNYLLGSIFWLAPEGVDRIELNIIMVECSADGLLWTTLYDDARGHGAIIPLHSGATSTAMLLSGSVNRCNRLRISYDFATYLGSDGRIVNLLPGEIASDIFTASASAVIEIIDGMQLQVDIASRNWLQVTSNEVKLTRSLGYGAKLSG